MTLNDNTYICSKNTEQIIIFMELQLFCGVLNTSEQKGMPLLKKSELCLPFNIAVIPFTHLQMTYFRTCIFSSHLLLTLASINQTYYSSSCTSCMVKVYGVHLYKHYLMPFIPRRQEGDGHVARLAKFQQWTRCQEQVPDTIEGVGRQCRKSKVMGTILTKSWPKEKCSPQLTSPFNNLKIRG